MKNIFKKISILLIAFSLIAGSFDYKPLIVKATQTFPDLETGYSTYLTTYLSSNATTMNVGTSTNVSTGFLVIEPRTTKAEIVYMTGKSGTTLTIVRGLAPYGYSLAGSSGTQRAHGAGSSVEMVDVHYYLKLLQIDPAFSFRGATTTTGLGYLLTPTAGDTAFNISNSTLYYYTGAAWAATAAPVSAGDASTVAKGVSEIATQLETASSTALGSSGATVVIPASNATSTYNSATAALRVVVTQNNGKIDPYFVSTSTLGLASSTNATLAGTTTVNSLVFIDSSQIYNSSGLQIGGLQLLAATTSGINLINFGTTTIPQRSFLRIVVKVPGNTSGGGNAQLNFNGDYSTNYSYSSTTCTAAFKDAAVASASNIAIEGQNNNTFMRVIDIAVNNFATTTKVFNMESIYYGPTAGYAIAPTKCERAAVWYGTSTPINMVHLMSDNNVFNSGTSMHIYGTSL